nr:protein Mis18-alpha isoform X1 [Nerophis lumbriciformis]
MASRGTSISKAANKPKKSTLLSDALKLANSTFETRTLDSTLVGESSQTVEDDDGPAVFVCGKCRLPVGDSMSWDGAEDQHCQIRLKRTTDNVFIGNDSRLHEASKGYLCIVKDLLCRGCHSVLGMVYSSTPKRLDSKRFTFCFNVADIESYVLGSASQMLAAEDPKEQPVTVEYKGRVEKQMFECCHLAVESGHDNISIPACLASPPRS